MGMPCIKAIGLMLLLWSLVSCQLVPVANYDATTDQMLTQLQQQVDLLFVEVKNNLGTTQANYKNYQPAYQAIAANLTVLQTRVSAIQNNYITMQQVKILQHSI